MFASIFHAVNKHSSVCFPIVRTTQIELSFDLIISFLFQFISTPASSLRMVYPIKCYNFPAENNISIIFRIKTYEWPLYPIVSFYFWSLSWKLLTFSTTDNWKWRNCVGLVYVGKLVSKMSLWKMFRLHSGLFVSNWCVFSTMAWPCWYLCNFYYSYNVYNWMTLLRIVSVSQPALAFRFIVRHIPKSS